MLGQIFLALGRGWLCPESIFCGCCLSLRLNPTFLRRIDLNSTIHSLASIKLPLNLLLVWPKTGSLQKFFLSKLRELLLQMLVLLQQLVMSLSIVIGLVHLPQALVSLGLGYAQRLSVIVTFEAVTILLIVVWT